MTLDNASIWNIFLGYTDIKKMNFIVFGAQANTGQGFGPI